MKKNSAWSFVFGLLFVVGLSALFYIPNQLRKHHSPVDPLETVPTATNLPIDPNFKPSPNDKLAFEAKATVTPYDGTITETFLQHDGKGSVRFEAKENGQTTEFFSTPESTIICDDFQCYAIGPDPDDPEMNVDEYIFTNTELGMLGQGLVLSGTEPCGALTCEVWTLPSPLDTDLPRVLLDTVSKNIIHVSEAQSSGVVSIDFEYKQVKIILPLNVEDLN